MAISEFGTCVRQKHYYYLIFFLSQTLSVKEKMNLFLPQIMSARIHLIKATKPCQW